MGAGGSAPPAPAVASLALGLGGARPFAVRVGLFCGNGLPGGRLHGMPGDGSHAMQATRTPMLVTLVVGALVTLGGLVAGPLALRLGRQPVAAAMGLASLLFLLLLFGLSLLGVMA